MMASKRILRHIRKAICINPFTVNAGWRGEQEAILICLAAAKGEMPHVTKEYNLAYVPEAGGWFGDMIAYGQWRDLGSDEIAELREAYDLDELVQDCPEYKEPGSGHFLAN